MERATSHRTSDVSSCKDRIALLGAADPSALKAAARLGVLDLLRLAAEAYEREVCRTRSDPTSPSNAPGSLRVERIENGARRSVHLLGKQTTSSGGQVFGRSDSSVVNAVERPKRVSNEEEVCADSVTSNDVLSSGKSSSSSSSSSSTDDSDTESGKVLAKAVTKVVVCTPTIVPPPPPSTDAPRPPNDDTTARTGNTHTARFWVPEVPGGMGMVTEGEDTRRATVQSSQLARKHPGPSDARGTPSSAISEESETSAVAVRSKSVPGRLIPPESGNGQQLSVLPTSSSCQGNVGDPPVPNGVSRARRKTLRSLTNTSNLSMSLRGLGSEENICTLPVHEVWKEKRWESSTSSPPPFFRLATTHSENSLMSKYFHKRRNRQDSTRCLEIIEGDALEPSEDGGDPSKRRWCDVRNLVACPNSTRGLIWNCLGLLAIGCDLYFVPLQVFDLPSTLFLRIFELSLSAFWTLDIASNFLTGFISKGGTVERRLRMIACHYLKGWFLMDLALVGIDWTILVAETTLSSLGLLRVGKTLRLAKSLRVLRLARLAKLGRIISQISLLISSEIMTTVVKLVLLLIFVLMSSHVIACAWYGMAMWNDGQETWVDHHFFASSSTAFRYLTSLHWALTQFTPASMEVFPRNASERALNVVVLIFGMVTFTSLISSISSAMSHLHHLRSESLSRKQKLREWLHENKVPMSVSARVWSCVKSASKVQHRIPQKNVVLLECLPRSVMSDLYEVIFQPVFRTHPFFEPYLWANVVSMRRLYDAAVSESYQCPGDELFHVGDPADMTYYVKIGRLTFQRKDKDGINVSEGSWLSEVALWSPWVHAGSVVAVSYTQLMSLEAKSFREIMTPYVIDDRMLVKYAALFAQRGVHQMETLDVWYDPEVLDDLVWAAFQEGVDFSKGLPLEDGGDNEELVTLPPKAETSEGQREVERKVEQWHDRIAQMRDRMAEFESDDATAQESGHGWAVMDFFRKQPGVHEIGVTELRSSTRRASERDDGYSGSHRTSGVRRSLRSGDSNIMSNSSTATSKPHIGFAQVAPQ